MGMSGPDGGWVGEVQADLRAFAQLRDWERFHTPKNLAMAVAGEAGELVAAFQWLTAEESFGVAADPPALREVAYEIADVLIYLLRLADVLGVDVPEAVRAKMRINADRYPAADPR